MTVKKLFVSIFLVFSVLFCNSTLAIEDGNIYIGIQMYKFKKPRIAKEITIINVTPNSPAWNVGIRTADRILKVNDIDVSNKTITEVQELISRKYNSDIKLTLKTRFGIKDFTIKQTNFNQKDDLIYPEWKNFCSDKHTDNEACFIHETDVIKKLIEFGYGPFYVSTVGVNFARQRYAFENYVYLCGKTKDPAMCYIQIQQNMQTQMFTKQLMQQQTIQNFTQNLELQNINQNLYNINSNIQMLKY